jgi:hypothetical protein
MPTPTPAPPVPCSQGNKIDIPAAASEDDLRYWLGLSGFSTGKGKVALEGNIRPIEIFMCRWGWEGGRGGGLCAAAAAAARAPGVPAAAALPAQLPPASPPPAAPLALPLVRVRP